MFIQIPASHMSLIKRKKVHGVGINDAPYKVTLKVDGKFDWCPYYRCWMDMLKRCYSKAAKESLPTYDGCSVCDEWLTFSNFKVWMITQDWKGKELDKDILFVGNKIYSPETCCFVDHGINTLLIQNKVKSKLPAGVYFNKAAQKFCAEIKIDLKKHHLGTFESAADASAAYRKRKRSVVIKKASMQQDQRIADGLLRHAEALL